MEKIDFKKELKGLYKVSPKKAEIVDIPPMSFLMVDGQGDPAKEDSYAKAIEALYAVSYTIKFMIKKGQSAVDYGVLPLEGLWWADDLSAFKQNRRDEWLWTMMIMQPGFVTQDIVNKAVEQVRIKKNPAALDKMRFSEFKEGRAAHILHIGPFSEEGPAVEKLHVFIAENNFEIRDKHHEIYLSDIRRAAPEKWQTIIRQPVQ